MRSISVAIVSSLSTTSGLAHYTVEISIGCVLLLTLANLRGVKETGALFAFPTYAFVASIFAMIAVGFVECATSGCPSAASQHVQPIADLAQTAAPLGLFVVLHAFSSGSTALTGVEAISNGVPAFKHPQSRNAATTLAVMGVMSITMFLGISWLAVHVHGVVPPGPGQRSAVGQIAFAVFGGGFGFYIVQAFTAAILILAANTSYQDFPRLSSILARDRFMPRQFANRGDRLVFSNGVIVLATLASLLIWAFAGSLDALIQLYVVGVFTAFTLSQAGMVVHWRRVRAAGKVDARKVRTSILINAVGAVFTGVVLVIIALTKFLEGAWISIVAVGVLVLCFKAVHRHYSAVGQQLRQQRVRARVPSNELVLVVPSVDAATAAALGYLRSISRNGVRAISTVPITKAMEQRWRAMSGGNPELESVPSGHGLLAPIRTRLAGLDRGPGDFVTVALPEIIRGGSLFRYLVRRRAFIRLKAGLLRERQIAVTSVPFVVGDAGDHGADSSAEPAQRTIALVFVSGIHDASIRAVNYARSLGALETRAVYFALDPGEVERVIADWFDRNPEIPSTSWTPRSAT